MPHLVYMYDPDTGNRLAEHDVTGLSAHEIIQLEFQTRCKWELYGVFVDTDKDGDLCASQAPNAPDTLPP